MKKLVVLLFVFTMNMFSISANNTNPFESKKKEIRTEIVKLLGNVEDILIENEIKVNVDLLVNKRGELIIIGTDSNNERINNFLKRKLNYKKVTKKLEKEIKTYRMPLTLKKAVL